MEPKPGENGEAAAKGQFGFNSREDEIRARESMGDGAQLYYRPLDRLRYKDISELEGDERLEIKELLTTTILEGHTSLAARVEHAIEDYNYKKLAYTVQRDVEISSGKAEQFENARLTAKEGQNERVLGLVERELKRIDASNRIFSWALPYKTTYYSGFDSLGLLAERGEQLALANMDRMINGIPTEWMDSDPVGLPDNELKKLQESTDYLPLVENGETMSDRYGRYFADADFWMRAIGEVNTYNPTIKGEKLNLSQPMQDLIGSLLQRRSRTFENGEKEKVELPTREITIYLDEKGDQIPLDATGKPIKPDLVKETKKAYVEVLDFYNKARSEDEMRWVVSVISALSANDAKAIIDNLPHDFSRVGVDENDPYYKIYDSLLKKVQADAEQIMKNYDILPRRLLDLKLARSAVYLSDAVSFASFDIAERGFNNEWKPTILDKSGKTINLEEIGAKFVIDSSGKVVIIDKDTKLPLQNLEWYYIWHAESSQGDPTASGDAFTAAKPYFHELVYQAIKNRISANNNGVLLSVDEKEAERLAQVYLSEAAEVNERGRVLEIIKSGKQQHLARYFGLMGAFKNELGNLPMWKQGEFERKKIGKKVNPNLSKAIEESVVFVPTPYNFKSNSNDLSLSENDKDYKKKKTLIDYIKSCGLEDGENILFPMVAAQHKIGLYDMLRAGKSDTVGDILRKVWKKSKVGEEEVWQESTFEEGGRRLTHKDVNWMMYARYADDSRAVNNNFMLQAYAPLYGTLNEKQIESAKRNPLGTILAAIKASDIGFRSVNKKFSNPTKESGDTAKRQSLEIMRASSIVFHQLALGVYNLVGRGSIDRVITFREELTSGEKAKGRTDNLYTILRGLEDFLQGKQGYPDYSDSFYCLFLAQDVALEPITIASNEMAFATTERFYDSDPTRIDTWRKVQSVDETKQINRGRSSPRG